MPAFGCPTSAASASSLRWSSTSASSPGMPISAKRGVWRVGVAKWRLPRPAPPPRATTTRRAGPREVGDELAGVVANLGADRHAQLDVLAGRAVPARAPAVAALAGRDQAARAEGGQVAELRVGDEHDGAPGAAVAAVRAAPWGRASRAGS